MNRLLLAVFSFFFSVYAIAQPLVKKYVQQNAVILSTISPTDNDLSELEVIGKVIGDAQIVMLGEQDHGDAATFEAKTRLIKYLHQKKGFTVLAFENDFFVTNFKWEQVKAGQLSIPDFINTTINKLWSLCPASRELFNNYIPAAFKSNNPLHITGVDNIMNTVYLYPMLDSLWKANKIPLTILPEYDKEIYPLLSTWYNHADDTNALDKINQYLYNIKGDMKLNAAIPAFWMHTVDNLISNNMAYRWRKKNYAEYMNVRDVQMAENIKWLMANKFPGQKIIIWAANYHVAKFDGYYLDAVRHKANPMGNAFTSDPSLMAKTYILGFTSFQGTAGRLNTKVYKVKKKGLASFESWINPAVKYAFVDFKKFNFDHASGNNEEFEMSGSVKTEFRHKGHKAVWNKIFDGVFYIKDMYSCLEK